MPRATIAVVEPNPDVIALREEFLIPADDDRFKVIQADGANYVAQLPSCEDVILADACDRAGIAPELDAVEFYHNARRSLAPGGIFVMNVCGEDHSRNAHMLKIRNAFEDEFLTLQVRPNGNIIMIAFKEPRQEVRREQPDCPAWDLKTKFRLDFPKFQQLIELGRVQRRGQLSCA